MAMFRKDSRALDALFSDEQGIDPTAIVEKQMTGHMYKCSLDGRRRWKRRFFVLKDGFLMYYEPREKPLVFFDFHPKGVLPLDGAEVDITKLTDGPKVGGVPVVCGISITHPSFGGRSLHLAVEEEAMRNTWVAALEASKHVTYKNAVTGSTSVDMYKDMATHAQTRMGKLSSDLIAARKAAKAAEAALATKNEYIMNVLAAVATAAAKHGVGIDLPDPPAVAPPAAPAAAAGSGGGSPAEAVGDKGVRFAGASEEGEGGELTLELSDKATAGSLAPSHGGSPGHTPAPTEEVKAAFPADTPAAQAEAAAGTDEVQGEGESAPADGESAPVEEDATATTEDATPAASSGNPFA